MTSTSTALLSCIRGTVLRVWCNKTANENSRVGGSVRSFRSPRLACRSKGYFGLRGVCPHRPPPLNMLVSPPCSDPFLPVAWWSPPLLGVLLFPPQHGILHLQLTVPQSSMGMTSSPVFVYGVTCSSPPSHDSSLHLWDPNFPVVHQLLISSLP